MGNKPEEHKYPTGVIQSRPADASCLAISYICSYIQNHIETDLSLEQCAELVGMSQAHVSRIFKKETGINFQVYLIECKVKKVQSLLSDTDLNIAQIADVIRYSERNLFRMFLKTIGKTPKQFRSSIERALKE